MPRPPYVDMGRPALHAVALRRALIGPGSFVRELRIAPYTGSTNADLAELARGGAPEGTVLVAEYQSAGRGRLDRAWIAPPRSGLTFSVLVRPDVPAARWTWLPLLAGCAVVEAVRRQALLEAVLKWPNDVLLPQGKLAGILLERIGTDTGPAAVIGIGLNVSTTAAELPVPGATSLALAGRKVDREVLLRELLRSLGTLYRAWCVANGDAAAGLADSYRARSVTLGRRVRAKVGSGECIEGTARDLDEAGRLLVDTGCGTVRSVSAGDVIHAS